MDMKKNSGIIFIVGMIIALVAITACTQEGSTTTTTQQSTTTTTLKPASGGSQELKKFSSTDELKEYLKQAQDNQGTSFYGGYGGMMMKTMSAVSGRGVAMAESAMDSSAQAPTASNEGSNDYSTTNIQVAGVDEPDFIKNDGKYIYIVNNNKFVIIDATPAEKAKVVYEEKIKGTPEEIFINGDKAVLFISDWKEKYNFPEFMPIPVPRSTSITTVKIYDLTDKTNPEVIEEYEVTGNYYDARMIGDYVYLVNNEYVWYYGGLMDTPMIKSGDGKIRVSPEVYYFDNPETSYNYYTVASFNLKEAEKINAKTYMMGYSNTLYVSENNIYVAYQKNQPYYWYRTNNQDRFFEIVVPLLPDSVQQEVLSIKSSDKEETAQWNKIADVLEKMYDGMDENDKADLTERIQAALDEYDAKQEAERRKTVIHKINVDKGNIEYKAQGEVQGYLLNQFSLDEKDGNLRVATTTYVWREKSEMYNNVFVLDSGMDVIGKLEDIAPDERIYSTRFMGDKLYMVTFKNIDPLFVIDLSNPEKPKILGELKIPGYSSYLHPYDETHIIGIGMDTESNEWGGTSTSGVKIALFDVSDVNSPKLVDSVEIGQRGSSTDVTYEHKAFLFDKNKNLLVIPIREVTGRTLDPKYNYYHDTARQGAYVFTITETGIEKKGMITHIEDKTKEDYYYSTYDVRRSLYIGNVLYTVSTEKIKMNDLGSLDEIKEVDLPKLEVDNAPTPVPYADSSAGSSGSEATK